ncbi:glycosyltransferase family 4 protein [Rubinisphaera brasiliensis]|uniref:glycosyltransferase family 4 protein n=1 Tax=Rubinisphaera brasiliensis TaxID=119 RepID=UPI00145C8293|nr:glycosyltransferase family 4 protein [Rubinisphaera brasiliensis]
MIVPLSNEPGIASVARSLGYHVIEAHVPLCVRKHTGIGWKRPGYYRAIPKQLQHYREWMIRTHKTVQELQHAVEDHDAPFDIVYSNSSVVDIGWRLAHRLNVPHVWHLREMAESHYDYRFIEGKRRFRKKLNAGGRVIAISNAVRSEYFPPDKKHTCTVIPNGVYDDETMLTLAERVKQKRSTRNGTLQAGIVGVVAPDKGIDVALHATKLAIERHHCSVHLHVVGRGAVDYYSRMADSLGLSTHVTFHGYQEDPTKLMLSLDIILNCSKAEGFGRTTIEGMACGAVPFVNSSGANSEIIEHGINGLVFDGSSTDLATCLAKAHTSPEYIARLQRECVARSRQYSNEQNAHAVGRVFEHLSQTLQHSCPAVAKSSTRVTTDRVRGLRQ